MPWTSWLPIGFVLLTASAVAGFAQQPASSPADFDVNAARGTVSRVVALEDVTQSYAVYVPSHYSADRAWPIIYAFDPFARGKTAIEVYKDAAEKYGYIVVGSNNSKNGPTAPQLAAAQAMWADTHKRFSIDKNRVYTTGLSGGARVATAFALYCYTCNVAGVIAHGAGYPVMQNAKEPANDHFAYYVAIGDADFNFPEIAALRQKKEQQDAPCKVKIYPGPHQWAPPEIAEDAIEWLELKAMQAGTEKADPEFVQRLMKKTQNEADAAQRRGDVLTEYYALRSLVKDFGGLQDTTGFAARLAGIKGSKELKSAEHKQQREIEEQAALTAKPAAELAQFAVSDPASDDPRQPSSSDPQGQPMLGRHIASVMGELRHHAKSSSSDHLVYARAFTQLWIQGLEAGQDAFRENRWSAAIACFELMAEAAPDQPAPLLFLAEARVRAGNKKGALKALEQAVQHGLKRAASLTQDPELQPLAGDPEFQRIVRGLSSD